MHAAAFLRFDPNFYSANTMPHMPIPQKGQIHNHTIKRVNLVHKLHHNPVYSLCLQHGTPAFISQASHSFDGKLQAIGDKSF